MEWSYVGNLVVQDYSLLCFLRPLEIVESICDLEMLGKIQLGQKGENLFPVHLNKLEYVPHTKIPIMCTILIMPD